MKPKAISLFLHTFQTVFITDFPLAVTYSTAVSTAPDLLRVPAVEGSQLSRRIPVREKSALRKTPFRLLCGPESAVVNENSGRCFWITSRISG